MTWDSSWAGMTALDGLKRQPIPKTHYNDLIAALKERYNNSEDLDAELRDKILILPHSQSRFSQYNPYDTPTYQTYHKVADLIKTPNSIYQDGNSDFPGFTRNSKAQYETDYNYTGNTIVTPSIKSPYRSDETVFFKNSLKSNKSPAWPLAKKKISVDYMVDSVFVKVWISSVYPNQSSHDYSVIQTEIVIENPQGVYSSPVYVNGWLGYDAWVDYLPASPVYNSQSHYASNSENTDCYLGRYYSLCNRKNYTSQAYDPVIDFWYPIYQGWTAFYLESSDGTMTTSNFKLNGSASGIQHKFTMWTDLHDMSVYAPGYFVRDYRGYDGSPQYDEVFSEIVSNNNSNIYDINSVFGTPSKTQLYNWIKTQDWPCPTDDDTDYNSVSCTPNYYDIGVNATSFDGAHTKNSGGVITLISDIAFEYV